MEVVYDDESLKQYMKAAVGVTPDRPILIDRFLKDVYKRQVIVMLMFYVIQLLKVLLELWVWVT